MKNMRRTKLLLASLVVLQSTVAAVRTASLPSLDTKSPLQRHALGYGGAGSVGWRQPASAFVPTYRQVPHPSLMEDQEKAFSEMVTKMSADPDLVYFPEQLAYLQLHARFCKSEPSLVLDINTRRCYPRGSQGPCNIDAVFELDRNLRLPICVVSSGSWTTGGSPSGVPSTIINVVAL